MATESLLPYATLPREYRDRSVLDSAVDAFGRAHWLLDDTVRSPIGPYDAVVVTVGDGRPYTTQLSSVRARFPMIDALPDGGFVIADARRHRGDGEQVQVFGPPGRASCAFAVGDGIEHFLTDEAGTLWVGYFDEGIIYDPLSAPGLRSWSSAGVPLTQGAAGPILDCYALNVDRRAVWACPHPGGFPASGLPASGNSRRQADEEPYDVDHGREGNCRARPPGDVLRRVRRRLGPPGVR